MRIRLLVSVLLILFVFAVSAYAAEQHVVMDIQGMVCEL